jgi:RHS repeat-associated protein
MTFRKQFKNSFIIMLKPFFLLMRQLTGVFACLFSFSTLIAADAAVISEVIARYQNHRHNPIDDHGSTRQLLSQPFASQLQGDLSGQDDLSVEVDAARRLVDPVKRARAMRHIINDAEPSTATAAHALDQGMQAYECGLFSEAIASYDSAWDCTQAMEHSGKGCAVSKQIGDRALAGKAEMLARLGRTEELQALFDSNEARTLTGRSGQILRNAKEGLYLMRNRPDLAFLCGPTALQSIYNQQHGRPNLQLREERSTPHGVSLARLGELSSEVGMEFQLAYRERGASLITPAVVHWEVGHYAAILEERTGHFHVVDPTFVDDFWMKTSVIDAEASGYFIVPSGALPTGWRPVDSKEAESIWGRGSVQSRNKASTRQSDHSTPKNKSCGIGMADYSAHLHMVSLNISDTPVAYTPSYGPEVAFEINYVERDASQPAAISHGHLGPQWLHQYHSFLETNRDSAIGDNGLHEVTVALPNGGYENFEFESIAPLDDPNPIIDFKLLLSDQSSETGNRFIAIYRSQNGGAWSLLEYQLRFPDGTYYGYAGGAVYNLGGTATANNYRIYMTSVSDVVVGNRLRLGYEFLEDINRHRLETITDATGGISNFLYADRLADFPALDFDPNTTEPLHIVGFLDPAGRHAQVHYDAAGRLSHIIDAVGIESRVTYDGASDQVDSLTTPYGTSTFRRGMELTDPDVFGWLEMEDPLGRIERLEYTQLAPGISPADIDAPDASQILIRPRDSRQYRNTFYWDKQAWAKHAGDYTKAYAYHWLHSGLYSNSTGVLESYQAPLENRVYYNYPGMTEPEDATLADTATLLFPSKIGRVADDGSLWLETREYNTAGNVTRFIDAAGRLTEIEYDGAVGFIPAGIRVLSVKVAGQEVTRYLYEDTSIPLLPTQIQAAGESLLTLTYNSQGQILTETQESEVTRYVYDQADGTSGDTKGNLLEVYGPGTIGKLVTFTYDGVNRVRTVMDSFDRITTFDYDALDRPTTTTFPDSTTETTGYGGRLYPENFTDRLGRLITWEYDAASQLKAEHDWGVPTEAALQGVGAESTHYKWCDCGSLTGVIDPAGNTTSWEHDVLGRVTRKILPDGRATKFQYTPRLGRLASTTRFDGTEVSYRYAPVGELLAVDFSDQMTPGYRYTYDPDYAWLTAISTVSPSTTALQPAVGDIIETVGYQYEPYASTAATAAPGAGSLRYEIGVLPNSTVRYEYHDYLGRNTSQSLLGSDQQPVQQTTWFLDQLYRLDSHTNDLGSYGYEYKNATGLLEARTMPASLTESYQYEPAALGGRRLQQLSRRIGTADPYVAYTYAYQNNDNLESTTETRTAEPVSTTNYHYDSQLRLSSAQTTEDELATDRFDYVYDAAGNRITALSPDTTAHYRVDSNNQPLAQTAHGMRRVVGTVSKPSQVQINQTYVPVDSELRFEGLVDSRDTQDVEIIATDLTGNVTTTNYKFAEPENTHGAMFQSDLNGNVTEVRTGEGTTQYQWDALDRLILAEVMSRDGATGLRKKYHYDPAGRLTQIQAETWDGSAWQSAPVEHYVFAGFERLQKRASDGTVLRKYFSDGFIEGSEAYLYGRDRLGSVVELIDADTGATVSTREYSPYGEIVNETGTVQPDFGYTGHFYDADLALHHAPFRVYDASLGRWLSADPFPDAELLPEGTNLYAYVGNDPVNYVDPLGLCKSGPRNNPKNSRATPPRQGGGNGTGNGGPPKRTASSASPSGGGDATNKGLSKVDDFVDLTKHRKDHILNRHASGAGKAGKTEFPSSWSNDRILHQVSDIATDPNATRGVGKWDSPYAIGTRDGVQVRVDFYPNNHPKYSGQISTAYPIN